MDARDDTDTANPAGDGTTTDPWRGLDLAGVTLAIGVGTGQLVELLASQVAAAGGNLLVMHLDRRPFQALGTLSAEKAVSLLQGRARQIPVRSESIDLLVASSVLREVPEHRLTVLMEEFWRVLVPGGRLRLSDIIEPTSAEHNLLWAERNLLVRKLGRALRRPTALAANVQEAARALRSSGFEDLGISILPGYALTDAWLEDTINALRSMAGQLVDRQLRDQVLQVDIPRLIELYRTGQQRAAERFVLRATKAGDLTVDMEAPYGEDALDLSLR